jgi:hypothetical protein
VPISRAAARIAAAAVLLTPWAAACGPGEPTDPRRASGAAGQGGSGAEAPGPSPAAPASSAPPASASPAPARPKRDPGADRPAGGSTPRGGTNGTGTGGTGTGTGDASGSGRPRITSVSLTAPDPRDGSGRPVSAMHQEGCGDPERINIHVDANDGGGRLNGMWYEYVVDAPSPLRGSSDFWELGMRREDSESYKTVIGPIEARPANAGGGTITITVHVRNTDGSEAPSRRVTATLLPCR